MRNLVYICAAAVLIFPSTCLAETIVFKDGTSVRGDIFDAAGGNATIQEENGHTIKASVFNIQSQNTDKPRPPNASVKTHVTEISSIQSLRKHQMNQIYLKNGTMVPTEDWISSTLRLEHDIAADGSIMWANDKVVALKRDGTYAVVHLDDMNGRSAQYTKSFFERVQRAGRRDADPLQNVLSVQAIIPGLLLGGFFIFVNWFMGPFDGLPMLRRYAKKCPQCGQMIPASRVFRAVTGRWTECNHCQALLKRKSHYGSFMLFGVGLLLCTLWLIFKNIFIFVLGVPAAIILDAYTIELAPLIASPFSRKPWAEAQDK